MPSILSPSRRAVELHRATNFLRTLPDDGLAQAPPSSQTTALTPRTLNPIPKP